MYQRHQRRGDLRSKLVKRLTAFHADLEAGNCYLALFRHQHNVEVSQ